MAARVSGLTPEERIDALGDEDRLSVGETSALLGPTIEALRYYEAEGLLGDVERDRAGRRRYRRTNLYAVLVVQAMREAGFGIADIRRLVAIKRPEADRAERIRNARIVLRELAEDVQRRQRALRQAKALLGRWESELDGVEI